MVDLTPTIDCKHCEKDTYHCVKRNIRCYYVSVDNQLIRLDLNCTDRERHFIRPKTVSDNQIFDDQKWVHKSSALLVTGLFDKAIRHQQRLLDKDRATGRGGRDTYKRGHYPFIPRSLHSLMGVVVCLQKYYQYDTKKITMIDCGAGIGNIILLFRAAGFDATGIEYDGHTLKAGRKFLGSLGMNPKRLKQGDLLKFKSFHKYDILYGYCPMADYKKERLFEDEMNWKAKLGALVIGLRVAEVLPNKKYNGKVFFKRLRLDKYTDSFTSVWQKVGQEKL